MGSYDSQNASAGVKGDDQVLPNEGDRVMTVSIPAIGPSAVL